MRKLLVALLAPLLAGCVSSDGGTDDEAGLPEHDHLDVPRVDAAALLADLQDFATSNPQRSSNLPDHETARDWLEEKFASYGLETYRHEFTDGIPQVNVVGIKWGTMRDQWVVVGAHYDVVLNPRCPSTPAGPPPTGCPAPPTDMSQGAYDDGSGTLLTVHLAQAFAQVDTAYTIAFVAFDGEERGLQGSGNFSETFSAGLSPYGNITFRAMLDLDMFGLNWPGVDTPIYFDSNSPELDAEVDRVAESIGMPAGEIKHQGISLGRSDYAHFFDLGVPTGFFISDFEEWQLPMDVPQDGQQVPTMNAYPFWHRVDTWDTMVAMAGSEADLEAGFQTAADLAAGVLCLMASQPGVVLTLEPETE